MHRREEESWELITLLACIANCLVCGVDVVFILYSIRPLCFMKWVKNFFSRGSLIFASSCTAADDFSVIMSYALCVFHPCIIMLLDNEYMLLGV